MYYENLIKGQIASIDFETLRADKNNPFPSYRSLNFMTLGPFVLKTDGAFETEYFYERNKTLDCDYLLSSGGEKNSVPYINKRVKNDYIGEEYLTWEQGFVKWNQLRFDKEGSDCDKIIYMTEQRNCVFYAAVYVNCQKEEDAFICYENSGSLLYLNGELIDNRPYGRTKGIADFGYQRAVKFRKGLNLILFKLRVGYICDTFDIGIANFMIIPAVKTIDGLSVSHPQATAAYVGSKENPRQLFPLFIGSAEKDCEEGKITFSSENYSHEIKIPALKKGECFLTRAEVPSDKEEKICAVNLAYKNVNGSFYVKTKPFHNFEGTEHLYSDFHFDTTYHQEQRTYAMGAMYITKRMAEALEKFKGFKATLSEVDYLHPFYSIYPEHRSTIKDAFMNGRAEADCFYNQPNDLTSSGEAFVRNLIYGQLYHRDVMGRKTYVYAPGDVFGHCNQLSQICKKGSVETVKWGKTVWGLDSIFHHISPDGSDLIHNKCASMGEAMRLGLTHSGDGGGLIDCVPAYPLKDDISWFKDTITDAHFSLFSDLDLGIIEDEKKQLEENGISNLEQCSRDLTRHHWGVLLTRTDFKQANRLCENLLVTAEKFSSIASLSGAEYPEKALDKAWRQLLCAQHHDSITGTNNEVSFVDLMIEYRETADIATKIIKEACAFISSGIKVSCDNEKVCVFNPHPWKRKDFCFFDLPQNMSCENIVLADKNGKEYNVFIKDGKPAFLADVAPLGYAVYYIKEKKSLPSVVTSSDTIENKFYRVKVDKKLGGGIVSIYDKKAKREVVSLGKNGPANRVAVLREVPDRMETQHEIYTTGQKLFSSDFKADITCEKCSEYEKLIIKVKLDIIAEVIQEITLYKDIKRIDCKTIVDDYQFRDDLFTLTFPVNLKGAKTVFDDRFAPHVSSKSINPLSFQTHQHVCYSHSRIIPANQWIDLGPTVTLNLYKNKKLSGKVNIGLTSIIRPDEKDMILSADKLLLALTKKAIPVTEFSDKEQHGFAKITHFNEDVCDTDTRFVLSVNKNEYEEKLLSTLTESERKRFLEKAEKDVAILYTKDNDNVFEKEIDVFLIKAPDNEKLNLFIEKISEKFATESSFDISPDIIKGTPVMADDYGVSIINNGTISCSVEGENMLNMMLFHTADFYGNMGTVTGAEQLIPEQKTHVFTYAIYPHEKSFREAEVYKKAFEFNDILISSQTKEKRNEILPESKSFVKNDSSFMITSMKLGGYPIAQMKNIIPSAEERGIVVRGFESSSNEINAKLSFDFDIKDIKQTDLLEENPKDIKSSKNSFAFDCTGNSIETFTLKAETKEKIGNAKLISDEIFSMPTYIRSWEHNLGSMPTGYLRTAGIIGRNPKISEDGKEFTFTVSMANNQPDAEFDGKMKFSVTDNLKIDKDEIEFNVSPLGMFTSEITVTKPDKETKGLVRLDYIHDGQNFFDIFEFGCSDVEVSLKFENEELVAFVKNDGQSPLLGELLLATPFESWKLENLNLSSTGETSIPVYPVNIKPCEEKEFRFQYKCSDKNLINSRWAAVKLAVNGRVYFAFDRIKGERHNKWTHEYWDKMIRENNGSIKSFLEMK